MDEVGCMPSLSELRGHSAKYTIPIVGGVVYALIVLGWVFSSEVSISSGGITTIAAFGYAWIGMFLTAAIPLFLFGRFSLVTPPLVTLWILGNTVYQWLYVTHPHPLSSYLTVWPLLVGFTLTLTLGEALLRLGVDQLTGRFGLRPVF